MEQEQVRKKVEWLDEQPPGLPESGHGDASFRNVKR